MNKPTQITLANSLPVSHSSGNSTAQQMPTLSEQTLSAKNIVFVKGSVQMEVYVDKHWQTLRLATIETQTSPVKIASADIQLSNDGKQLNITPKQTEISLNQPKQLQNLLNFLNSGNQVDNKPLPVQVILQPASKLVLNQLQASMPINKEVAQLLQKEPGLKVIITPNRNDFTLSVVNRFADTLHQQPINQTKLALWLSKLLPKGQLQVDKNTAILSFDNYKGSVKIALPAPLHNQQQNQSSSVTQKVQLIALNEQLIIKTQLSKVTFELKNSLSHTFNTLMQKSQLATHLHPPITVPLTSPSLNSSSPISSWLQNSFADLKTRINDAVRYFESKPFSQFGATDNKKTIDAISTQLISQSTHSLLPKSLTQINLAALAANNNQPLQADISQATALPKHFHQSPALVQMFQQVKAGLACITQPIQSNWPSSSADTLEKAAQVITQSQNTVASETQLTKAILNTFKTSAQLSPAMPLKGPITNAIPASQISQPIEAKLLATLLGTEQAKPLPDFKNPIVTDKQQLTVKIEQFVNNKVSNNPDLNRLVNQAFSRMIDSQSLQPFTVQREILSILRPESLPPSTLQNSFSQSLEHLAVGILASPSLANISALNFNSHSSLDALLHVLVPNFKATNTQQLQEQLLQPQSQALAAELTQIKTAISQVISTPINQQPDSNPLVQFLLPMRLPPEAAQTEISLGQYKKPSKDQLEGKSVWFVRLNFDYAELGQLQITAELMDKALDCRLLASSQDVTAMAHPHLDSLRHKLTAHGLQVGDLSLSQGAPEHQAFYQSHAIINIKV